jgi:hypothetical protein
MKHALRFYLAACLLGLTAYAWAEHYGYVLTGSNETERGHQSHSRFNHK